RNAPVNGRSDGTGVVPATQPLNHPTAPAPPLDPSLWAYHEPVSLEAEAYRGVRTTLSCVLRGKGAQVIQVTGPEAGDGTATLAANLAITAARSGKRVVLVDANFRRPRLHALFGLCADPGLSSLLENKGKLDEAPHATGVPGLWVLPCGPLPQHPAELL